MTKKHFVTLAENFKNLYARESGVAGADRDGRLAGIRLAAHAVADACAESNPRFNKARFLAACEVNANVR